MGRPGVEDCSDGDFLPPNKADGAVGRSRAGAQLSTRSGRYWNEQGVSRFVSNAEYRRLRRRITNRRSAQRMRSKRNEQQEGVLHRVEELRTENDSLKAACQQSESMLGTLQAEAHMWRERTMHTLKQYQLCAQQFNPCHQEPACMSGLWDLESCNAVQAQAADLLAAHVRLQSSVTQPFDDPAAVDAGACCAASVMDTGVPMQNYSLLHPKLGDSGAAAHGVAAAVPTWAPVGQLPAATRLLAARDVATGLQQTPSMPDAAHGPQVAQDREQCVSPVPDLRDGADCFPLDLPGELDWGQLLVQGDFH